MHLNKFTNQAAYDAGIANADFPAVSLVGEGVVYDKVKPGPTNYIKIDHTREECHDGLILFGDVVELGSGFDISDLTNNHPVVIFSDGEIESGDSWHASESGLTCTINADGMLRFSPTEEPIYYDIV